MLPLWEKVASGNRGNSVNVNAKHFLSFISFYFLLFFSSSTDEDEKEEVNVGIKRLIRTEHGSRKRGDFGERCKKDFEEYEARRFKEKGQRWNRRKEQVRDASSATRSALCTSVSRIEAINTCHRHEDRPRACIEAESNQRMNDRRSRASSCL